MQSLAFAFVTVFSAIAYQQAEANIDFQAVFDEAERAIDRDFTSRFFNGAKSDRFLRKKTTAMYVHLLLQFMHFVINKNNSFINI